MMESACEVLSTIRTPPLLIGVTVLTSMDASDLSAIGVERSPLEQVELLGRLAKSAGLDGVVCSSLEVPAIKAACGASFLTVTPGIRPQNSQGDDQRRVLTPAEAIQNGSDYLVVGRPITKSDDPAAACRGMVQEIVQEIVQKAT